MAAIEELERLFPLLKEAVNAELADKVGAKAVEIELKAKEGASIEIAEQACLATVILSFQILHYE